jgi:hypothetical protein
MAICHQPSASRRATSIWSGLRRLGYIKNQALLDRLEMMKPGPNVQRLAQELAEQNKALPREQRHGPRGILTGQRAHSGLFDCFINLRQQRW